MVVCTFNFCEFEVRLIYRIPGQLELQSKWSGGCADTVLGNCEIGQRNVPKDVLSMSLVKDRTLQNMGKQQ